MSTPFKAKKRVIECVCGHLIEAWDVSDHLCVCGREYTSQGCLITPRRYWGNQKKEKPLMKYLVLFLFIALCACSKKEDAPKGATPHVAGSWVGTGTDDATGHYNISMDLVQSEGSASGTFRMVGNVATINGNVTLSLSDQGAYNLRALTMTRENWTVSQPGDAIRVCAGDLTLKNTAQVTSGVLSFYYTLNDCAGGTWEGGASLRKSAGTN